MIDIVYLKNASVILYQITFSLLKRKFSIFLVVVIMQNLLTILYTHFCQLIEYECRAKEQVLVLMRLGEDQTALRRALQSGDTDLIYTVLHHLRQKLSSGDFLVKYAHEFVLYVLSRTLKACF